jgi:type I restriction enzyme S subunit
MSNKFKVTNKTTLFSKLNPRIKRVWFIDNVKENAICSTEFVPYKAKNNELIYFVYGLINSDFFYNQAMSIVNGATGSHQRFHPQDTLKFNIAFNESVAKEYSSIAEPVVNKILVNQQEITHLTNLRDTLLPKLMSGEIDVNEVEI